MSDKGKLKNKTEIIEERIQSDFKPYDIARELGVYPNAIRYQLNKLGYHFNDDSGKWEKVGVHAA